MSGGGGGDNEVKDTPEQKALAEVAAQKWNYAQEKLAPLEDAYMEQVGGMTDSGKMSYISGRAMQGQQQATSEAADQVGDQLQNAGVDPSSGRYQDEMAGLAMDGAQAGGETAGRAQFEQENQQIAGLQNIVSIGQGEAGRAQQGLGTIADQSAADARQSAANKFNRRSANLQLLGQVAGAGASYGLSGTGGSATGGTASPGFQPGQGLDLYGSGA